MTTQDLVKKYRGDYIYMMESIEALGYRFQVCRRRVRIYYDDSHETVKESKFTDAQYAMMHHFIEVKADTKSNSILEAARRFWDSVERSKIPHPQELIEKI